MSRVIHFEIHVPDPAAAKAFYERALGWTFTAWQGPEEYWLVTTGKDAPGIDGGLLRSKDGQPRTVNTVQVENVDATTRQIVAGGGQVVVPKMPIPGVGWLAYCTDPGGAIFGVMHPDPQAQ
jgi:predicted enzyme related to lactoylglutathione lyase